MQRNLVSGRKPNFDHRARFPEVEPKEVLSLRFPSGKSLDRGQRPYRLRANFAESKEAERNLSGTVF